MTTTSSTLGLPDRATGGATAARLNLQPGTDLGHLRRLWRFDLERILHHVTFRCRCGLHAHALRVTRPTRDGSEVLFLVESQRSTNG